MIIAVDFDGTIVEDEYPAIGPAKIFAFETLREMIKARHELILWTTREGKALEEAVEFCGQQGVDFYAVNKSFPEEKFDEATASRKIACDLFISAKNFGPSLGWGEIWQEIKTGGNEDLVYGEPKQSSFLQRLISIFSKS